MIDRVALRSVPVGRAGVPFPSGQVFTAEAMRELAALKPERYQWDEQTGELRRILAVVYEGNTVFIC
ncbi:MAG TPA: hypothetical protein VN256_08165 [Pyrinomonadaceae bacterium]|nr:hypothetical protein [Pyrinomonadaceae bacterium]